MCKWEQVSKRKQKRSDPAACTSFSLPHTKSIDKPPLVLDILHPFLRERVAKGFVQPCVIPRELKLWSRKWCESSSEGMLPVQPVRSFFFSNAYLIFRGKLRLYPYPDAPWLEPWIVYLSIYTSSSRASRGRKFRKDYKPKRESED